MGYNLFGMWGARQNKYTECWVKFTGRAGDKINIGYISFRYTLKLNKPWSWEPGVYTGQYVYRIGPGKDLDFGNNFNGSADDVTLNFTLTVIPDMYVHFNANDGGAVNADMQPPGGWLNWESKMPPYLSNDTQFDFGTSGPVKIHLADCDHPVGDTCGIVDLNGSGSPLGVDALLTDNRLNDDSSKQTIRSRLSTNERVFTPNTEGGQVCSLRTCYSRRRMA